MFLECKMTSAGAVCWRHAEAN